MYEDFPAFDVIRQGWACSGGHLGHLPLIFQNDVFVPDLWDIMFFSLS